MTDAAARLNDALRDRYRIERELGTGGMATVYLAQDLKHNRHVALKVLRPELAAVVGTERFLAEIETTANLQHPHILPLFDSGEADRLLFYVMPYVDGESLRDRLDREHQLPVDEAVRIATNVAEALDYAHAQGVVHRDIKPENILLQAGKSVVSDFGIALALGAAGGGRLTETGLSLGTPQYMSPEQVTGDTSITGAADVYALGALLYEMLVGDPPYAASTPQGVIGRMMSEPVPWARRARPNVPRNVDAAIRRALERLPADRFPDADAFAQALQDLDYRYREPEGDGRGVGRRGIVAAAVIGIVAGALGSALALGIGDREPDPIRFGAVTKVTFGSGVVLNPALSPDGGEVAYTEVRVPRPGSAVTPLLPDSLHSRVMVRAVHGGPALRLTTESVGSENTPAWTPDGEGLVLSVGSRIHSVPSRGGAPRPITPEAPRWSSSSATWAPSGSEFAYAVGGRLVARTLEGRERVLADEVAGAHSPAWGLDGRWIAFVRGNASVVYPSSDFGNAGVSRIFVVAAEGGEPIPVTSAEGLNLSPAWLPDGRLLFVSSREGGRDIFSVSLGRDGRPVDEPVRVTAGLSPLAISVSRDGSRLAWATFSLRQNIHRKPIPTTGVRSAYEAAPVTSGNQLIEGMAISPDGEWIAFDSDRSGNQDIYRRRLSGGEYIRLTTDPQPQFVRSWPDEGGWIAGHGIRGVRDILLVSEDGLDVVYPLPSPFQERYPDVSPDGRRIVFDRDDDGRRPMIMDVDAAGVGSEPELIADEGSLVRWSPDGSRIAFRRNSGEVLVTVPGGEPRVVYRRPAASDAYATAVEWHAEGERLLLLLAEPTRRSLWSIRTDGTGLREVLRFDDPARQPRVEMAVHGEEVFFTLSEFETDIWVADLVSR